MTERFPHHNFLAELLHGQGQLADVQHCTAYLQPTLLILSKLLVEYTLRTLTATL